MTLETTLTVCTAVHSLKIGMLFCVLLGRYSGCVTISNSRLITGDEVSRTTLLGVNYVKCQAKGQLIIVTETLLRFSSAYIVNNT